MVEGYHNTSKKGPIFLFVVAFFFSLYTLPTDNNQKDHAEKTTILSSKLPFLEHFFSNITLPSTEKAGRTLFNIAATASAMLAAYAIYKNVSSVHSRAITVQHPFENLHWWQQWWSGIKQLFIRNNDGSESYFSQSLHHFLDSLYGISENKKNVVAHFIVTISENEFPLSGFIIEGCEGNGKNFFVEECANIAKIPLVAFDGSTVAKEVAFNKKKIKNLFEGIEKQLIKEIDAEKRCILYIKNPEDLLSQRNKEGILRDNDFFYQKTYEDIIQYFHILLENIVQHIENNQRSVAIIVSCKSCEAMSLLIPIKLIHVKDNFIYFHYPYYEERAAYLKDHLKGESFQDNFSFVVGMGASITEGLTYKNLKTFCTIINHFTSLYKINFEESYKNTLEEKTKSIYEFEKLCFNVAYTLRSNDTERSEPPTPLQRKISDVVIFPDIIGNDKAKNSLLLHIYYLKLLRKSLVRNRESDLLISKGIVLTGPTQSGKTFFVNAFANESITPLLTVDFSQGNHIGLEDRFQQACAMALRLSPCILYLKNIDEFFIEEDYMPQYNEIRRDVIIPGLKEIKESGLPIFVVCSAKEASSIDPIFSKVGMFDTIIEFFLPNTQERIEFLQNYIEKNKILFGNFDEKFGATQEEVVDFFVRITDKFSYNELTLFIKRLIMACVALVKSSSPATTEEAEDEEDIEEHHVTKTPEKKLSRDQITLTKDIIYPLAYDLVYEIAQLNKKQGYVEKNWDQRILFKDVFGMIDLKEYLIPYIDYLKNYKKYREKNIRASSGILLEGPPGVGKSYIARAFANEAGVKIFEINASQIMNKYVGESEKSIARLFKEAKNNAPCVILIDEVDSLMTRRGEGEHSKYQNDVTNQFLVEIDHIQGEGIVVICTTNRADLIDPAITRSGRIEGYFLIDHPTKSERMMIIEGLAKKRKLRLSPSLTIERIAEITSSFSAADIDNFVGKLQKIMLQKNEGEGITLSEVREVVDSITLGEPKQAITISKEEYYETAIHEAGHLVAFLGHKAYFDQKGEKLKLEVDSVSIVPRTRSLGVNCFRPVGDIVSMNKDDIYAKIRVGLGGYVAEQLFYKRSTSGVSSDLMGVKKQISSAIDVYAMEGTLIFDEKKSNEEKERLFRLLLDQTKILLTKNKKAIEVIANALMERTTLSQEDIQLLLQEKGITIVYFE